MNFRLAASAVAFIGLLSSASAQAFTVSFPSSQSNVVSAGGYFFESSHYVTQNIAGTGLQNLNSLSLHFIILENYLINARVNFDVLVNGVDVGDISFGRGNVFDFLLNFAPVTGKGPGDLFTLTLDEKNTVPVGGGAIRFDQRNSSATLNGQPLSKVPEPGTIALLGLGLIGLVGRRCLKG